MIHDEWMVLHVQDVQSIAFSSCKSCSVSKLFHLLSLGIKGPKIFDQKVRKTQKLN